MSTIQSPKIVAAVTTALFIASVFWLVNTKSVNATLESGLEKEKLKSEAMLSEKLSLEKDVQKMKAQLASLKGLNSDLDNRIRDTEGRMAAREAELSRLKKQQASVAQVKAQREELRKLHQDLENELQALRASYATLENQNAELRNTVFTLQERNRVLHDDLNRAMFASVDHSRVDALKGKREKLTVKARQTKKLTATFEVPSDLKQLSFRLLDTKGRSLSNGDGTIAFHAVPSDMNYTVSSDESANGKKLQKVTMQYLPKKKLQPGTYTVEILNDDLYVASLNVKLR